MKVLVTGGSGNIGPYVVGAVVRKGHEVTIFDQTPPSTFDNSVKVALGDIRNVDSVAGAVEDHDAVVHMAAILPPVSETNRNLSYAVNVIGTTNVIKAMQQSTRAKRLVFASTTAVHGSRFGRRRPITADEPLAPPDEYAKQKILAEEQIRHSGLNWTILRIPAVPPLKVSPKRHGGQGSLLFHIPADGHIEVLHPDDLGLAFANAISSEKSLGRVLLLGGGRNNGCQLTGYEFTTGMTSAFGIGQLPKEIFGNDPGGAHAEWLDTTESQSVLAYQQHTFEQLTDAIRKNWGLRYYLVRALSPAIRFMLIRRYHRS